MQQLTQAPVVLALIGLTVAVSMLAWRDPRLLERLSYEPLAVGRGEVWRLLTHGFVHADGQHLAFNMITLFFFGAAMESILTERIGALGFAGFYLAGIGIAILPTHLRHRGDTRYRGLGASGGVAAVLFSYILLQPWSLLFVFFVPVPAILFAGAYMAYSIWAQQQARDSINHSAHLWGAAWGVCFMALLEPAVIPAFLTRISEIPI